MLDKVVDAVRKLTRPVVTYSLVGAVIAAMFMGRDSGEVMTLTTAVIAFWFGSRSGGK